MLPDALRRAALSLARWWHGRSRAKLVFPPRGGCSGQRACQHAQLGIPETAHGPTLEYRHLSHGCSTHHDAVHGGRQDEKLAIANAVMATLQAKREELARNPNAESAAEIKKAMDRHVNSVRENRVRALTSNPSLSAAGEGGSCSPRHPSPMAIWCHGSDRRVRGLVSFRVKARVSLNPGLPANLLQHQ